MHRSSLLPLVPMFILLLSGCSPTEKRTVTAESAREITVSPTAAAPQPVLTVSFKTGPNLKVGFKYRLLSEGEIKTSEEGSPIRKRATTDYELVKIENGEYTWKQIQNDQILDMGDNTWMTGKGPSKNRLSLVVKDAYGNTLRSEGEESTTTMKEGKSVPDHPVKVGDSWEYTVVQNNAETHSVDTLERVVTIDGVQYAIISEVSTGDYTGRVKMWVSLETGVTVKGEAEVRTINDAGEPASATASVYVIRPEGIPLIP